MVFLFVLVAIILILLFSKIRFEVDNFIFASNKQPRHINKNYKFVLKICILYKIPIMKVNITKNKLEKLKLKEKFKNIDFNTISNNKDFNKKILRAKKVLNIEIKKIDLKINLGTENASVTPFIIVFLSMFISILFKNKVKNYKNQNFTINPVYINQNIINMRISGIFEVKMIHIINIIYILNRKEGVNKNERTSNRRSYDYSYE